MASLTLSVKLSNNYKPFCGRFFWHVGWQIRKNWRHSVWLQVTFCQLHFSFCLEFFCSDWIWIAVFNNKIAVVEMLRTYSWIIWWSLIISSWYSSNPFLAQGCFLRKDMKCYHRRIAFFRRCKRWGWIIAASTLDGRALIDHLWSMEKKFFTELNETNMSLRHDVHWLLPSTTAAVVQ